MDNYLSILDAIKIYNSYHIKKWAANFKCLKTECEFIQELMQKNLF